MKRLFIAAMAAMLVSATCHKADQNIYDWSAYAPDTATMYMDTLDIRYGQKEWTGPDEILPANYRPSASKSWNLVHTDLYVSFDFAQRRLEGYAQLTLELQFYPTDTVLLDAKHMLVHGIWLKSGKVKTKLPFRYSDSLQLVVQLPETYKPAANGSKPVIELDIEYTARPYEVSSGGSSAITDDRGLYFINHDLADPSKPRQIWTQGETQSNSRWFPTIDAPNQKTTQRIHMTVPDSMMTLSNGLMVESQKNPDGTRTDVWEQKQPHAPYLVMMAVGQWAEVKDQWKGRPVNYYVEKEYEATARLIFGKTPEMISFFSDYTGVEYPWSKYSQVVVRDFVSGAMENTSTVVHMGGLQHTARQHIDDTYEDYISHELFHHWFGDLVTTESWSNITLNESFATYGEYLWREFKYGRDNADGLLEEFRFYYDFVSRFGDEAKLVRYDYHSREDVFDIISYQKGALILHMLRKQIGDDAFRAGMKLYLTRNSFKSAEVAQLRMAFEEVTGLDLNWFFNQWYFDKKRPEIALNSDWDAETSRWTLHINQTQTHRNTYVLPLTLKWSVNGTVTSKNITVDSRIEDFSITLPAKPEWWLFDADNTLLADVTLQTNSPEELTETFRMLSKAWDENASAGIRHRIFQTGEKLFLLNQEGSEAEQNMLLRQGWEPLLRKALASSWRPTQIACHSSIAAFCNDEETLLQSFKPGLLSVAANRQMNSEARVSALRMLAGIDWNSDSLYVYTKDSSIVVAEYAIHQQQSAGPWISYARNFGIFDQERDIAVAWARRLMEYEPESSNRIGVLKKITENSKPDAARFMAVFGTWLSIVEGAELQAGLDNLLAAFTAAKTQWAVKGMAVRIKPYLKKLNQSVETDLSEGKTPDAADIQLQKTMQQIMNAAAG